MLIVHPKQDKNLTFHCNNNNKFKFKVNFKKNTIQVLSRSLLIHPNNGMSWIPPDPNISWAVDRGNLQNGVKVYCKVYMAKSKYTRRRNKVRRKQFCTYRSKHGGIQRTMHCRLSINFYTIGQRVGEGQSKHPSLFLHILTSQFRNNKCKDDSALFSRFLHESKKRSFWQDAKDLRGSYSPFYGVSAPLTFPATV